MPPVKLRTLLLAILAVTAIAFGALAWGRALVALEVQSGTQAIDRVRAQALLARAAVEQAGGRLLVTARVLADRPTLQRLVEFDDPSALTEFLDRFAEGGELRSCAVLRAGEVLAIGGEPIDAIVAAYASGWELDQWRLLVGDAGPVPLVGVRAGVRFADGIELLVLDDVAPLDLRGAEPGGSGPAVELVSLATARSSFQDPRVPVWNQSLQTGALEARRVHAEARRDEQAAGGAPGPSRGDSFEAALPILDGSGERAAVLSVSLPASLVDAPREAVGRRLLRDQVLLALATAGCLWLIGLRMSQNLESLTAAALRIRDGDLQTPVPGAAMTREAVELSRAMEEMRGTMLQLTLDLQRERSETEGVLNGIADGVFAVDRERRIRYLSPQAEAILGVRAADALGRFCGDVLDPEPVHGGHRPCDDHCPILEARSVGSVRRTEVVRGGRGTPRSLVLVSSADPLGREPDSRSRQVQVVREESDQEVSRRLRDNVVANVSHEFRTPLSAQLASVEMLRERMAGEDREELAPLLGSIERANVRLARLVDNLLESLSIDAGRAGLRRQDVAVEEVCMEAVDTTLPLIRQKGQRLQFEFGPDLPAIPGDRARLVQVFVNLLANANKYAPASTAIRIGARRTPEGVEAWVEDEGAGLPQEDPERLFERFVQAAGEQPGQGGLGLGLWLVRSIVERHGGRVEVIDRGPGSRFLVTLPGGERP